MVGRKVVASLMCVVVALIAAAPLAQSEPGAVHEIVKDENGPPSTCAETWEITPSKDWTWHGHIVNYGLRWVIIDVMDMETGDILVDREMYRFASYPEGWVDTEKVDMVAGHTYSITATPNGPLGSRCTVEDVLEGGPVASFTASVDGATVSVDASASYDPDGVIVSYDWNWGDGSVGNGKTATHTYVPPEQTALSSPILGALPFPHVIFGHTYDTSANPLPNCTVTITNLRLGLSATVQSDGTGLYQTDLANMAEPYEIGDEILVEAVKDTLSGSATGSVTDAPFDIIDVTLEPAGPPPNPYLVVGYANDVNGNPLAYCPMTVTNLRTGVSASVTSYLDGAYLCNLANMAGAYEDGDEILVESATNVFTGSAVGQVSLPWPFTWINVTMEWSPPSGPFEVTITLTVTDDDGLTDTTARTVTVEVTPPQPVPPVAAFSAIVDGMTVFVNASASYDLDGEIVSYEWDWGDGSVGTGETAAHTYVPPEAEMSLSGPILGPPVPHYIVGYTYDVYGDPLPNCTMTIINVRLCCSDVVTSDEDGAYMYDLLNMWEAGIYQIGDEILVEAWKDSLSGSAIGYVTSAPYDMINVTLEEGGSIPFVVTITLTVTDDDGLESTESQVVVLYLPLFSEDFADLDNWTVFDTGGLVDLDSSGDAIDPPSLEVHKQQVTGETRAYREFTTQSGNFHIEARMKVATTCWGSEGWAYFIVGAGSAASVTFCFQEGYLKWYEQDDQHFHSVMAFSVDTPYLIGFDIDVQAGTYDIYVDDVLKWSNAELRQGIGVPLDRVTFQAGWLDLCYGTHLWVDDVELATA
ncbi:MAG: PKD domain-containing protein [Methanobacteriota archaeon]|nr:MAG: PKD domain-containing protein [Euryarchaeota archaeon]